MLACRFCIVGVSTVRYLRKVPTVSLQQAHLLLGVTSVTSHQLESGKNICLSSKLLKMSKSSGNRLSWDVNRDIIEKSTEELIVKAKQVYDAVGNVGAQDATYASVIKV